MSATIFVHLIEHFSHFFSFILIDFMKSQIAFYNLHKIVFFLYKYTITSYYSRYLMSYAWVNSLEHSPNQGCRRSCFADVRLWGFLSSIFYKRFLAFDETLSNILSEKSSFLNSMFLMVSLYVEAEKGLVPVRSLIIRTPVLQISDFYVKIPLKI